MLTRWGIEREYGHHRRNGRARIGRRFIFERSDTVVQRHDRVELLLNGGKALRRLVLRFCLRL